VTVFNGLWLQKSGCVSQKLLCPLTVQVTMVTTLTPSLLVRSPK
jgi:hypothetical protein